MKPSIPWLRNGIVGVAALGLFRSAALADSGSDGGTSIEVPQPIPITVLKSNPDTAPGLIFLTPTAADPTGVQGAQIVDGQGRPVWFHPLPTGEGAYDLRVQVYHHEPVLTWIQSKGVFSTGPTTDYIADRHYHVIATVNAGNGLTADIHEFHLTREGTALITAYRTVPADLSSVGGPASGLVTEGVVQEIDIDNGRVLFEWHSLDHVGLEESEAPVSTSPTVAWDYFHLNAVSVDEDGNLLINARNTWTAYRLDRHSGKIIWRLGGKKTDFVLGPNVAFAWEHNPTAVDDHGLIRIFDNEASPPVLPYSRVIWVRHDDVNKTATLERSFQHPDGLSAGSQGNAQGLENGDTFIGWGALTRFSEIDARNNLLFDAELPTGYNSYRAYRFEWVGEPDTRPVATAQRTSEGDTLVHAVWNGATEVAQWDVVRGGRDEHRPLVSSPWNGLDTTIQVGAFLESVAVVARDRAGRELARSEVTPVAQ
jgi:hypothetical protein